MTSLHLVTNAFALGVCGVAIPGFAFRANTSALVGPTATPAPSAGNGSSGGIVPFTGGAGKVKGMIGLVSSVCVGGLALLLVWAL